MAEPVEAFVAVGSITVMQRKFFTEGDGVGVLGDQKPIAVTAASELEEDFWRIGALFLSEAEVAIPEDDVGARLSFIENRSLDLWEARLRHLLRGATWRMQRGVLPRRSRHALREQRHLPLPAHVPDQAGCRPV